jgi:hypothetical protein
MEQAPIGDQEQLVPAAEPAVPSDGAPAAAPAAGRAGAPHGNGWASALNDTQREVPSWDLRQGGSVTRSVGPEERRAAEKARCDAVKAEDKKRAPTAYLLKFLSGESSQVGEDLSCYAPALSAAGFRNKILLKQLTKKDLVRCNVKKEHVKILLREVKRLRIESKAAAKTTAAKIAAIKPPDANDPAQCQQWPDAMHHFQLVRGWLATLSERSGEDMSKYGDDFYEYGIDMMSSVPLIEQSDLRDMGMNRHHAEIFLAAAEEEKRRQIAEGDRWCETRILFSRCHFMLMMSILPRQARDKHRKSTQQEMRSSQGSHLLVPVRAERAELSAAAIHPAGILC